MKNDNNTIIQDQGEMLSSGSSIETFEPRSMRNCTNLVLYAGMNSENIPNLRVRHAERWLDMSSDLKVNEDINLADEIQFINKKTAQAFTDQLEVLEQYFGKKLSKDLWLFPDANGQQISDSTVFRWIDIRNV